MLRILLRYGIIKEISISNCIAKIISSMCHIFMTDFAYDRPIFLVPLSLLYPSLPVLVRIELRTLPRKNPLPYSVLCFRRRDFIALNIDILVLEYALEGSAPRVWLL